MIKLATTTGAGRKIVLLGITEKNVERLREGKPIHVHGEELNLSGFEIWITLGKDEKALEAQFKPLIGPETIVRDHRTARRQ